MASLNEHLLLAGRFRKYNVLIDTKLGGSKWSEVDSLEDKILLLDFTNCTGNFIYFTDDFLRNCCDVLWETSIIKCPASRIALVSD
ncbi:hypothetical protein NC651_004876 [Populus alba x Populus x berolinensis]|nr:hypothetical protein NC651_004876 [Populus alba x Populus x berolinensis]